MVVSRMTKILGSILFLATASINLADASIDSKAMSAHGNNAQMVNLNLQFKSKNKTEKSNLTMPFYQTAELERKIGDKSALIEILPKRGKSSDEITLEMKFYRAAGSKAFYKKEIVAKMNEDSHVTFRGFNLRVRPVVNSATL